MPNDVTPESCHDLLPLRQPQTAGKGPFLCSPYMTDGSGRYEPSPVIDRCPLAAAGDRCQICRHSFRNRKTGPEIPLCVLRCKPHGRYFTVYPPGHVPYGRCCVAVVDLCGEPIERSELEPEASCLGVVFEAALDASRGSRWESEPTEELDRPRYPTQRRRIQLCTDLLGLDRRLSGDVVEWIRDDLGIDGLDHHLACIRHQQAVGLKARGTAILDVHQRAVRNTSCVLRLLAAGSRSGLWGHPWLWDPARGQRFSLLDPLSRAPRAPS